MDSTLEWPDSLVGMIQKTVCLTADRRSPTAEEIWASSLSRANLKILTAGRRPPTAEQKSCISASKIRQQQLTAERHPQNFKATQDWRLSEYLTDRQAPTFRTWVVSTHSRILYPTSERQCRLPTSESRPPKADCRPPERRPPSADLPFFQSKQSSLGFIPIRPDRAFKIFECVIQETRFHKNSL